MMAGEGYKVNCLRNWYHFNIRQLKKFDSKTRKSTAGNPSIEIAVEAPVQVVVKANFQDCLRYWGFDFFKI